MGGKSRKRGQVSKKLIDRIKQGGYNNEASNNAIPKKKPGGSVRKDGPLL